MISRRGRWYLHEWVVSLRCSALNGDFISGSISCLLMVQHNLDQFCVPGSRSCYAKGQKADPLFSLCGTLDNPLTIEAHSMNAVLLNLRLLLLYDIW